MLPIELHFFARFPSFYAPTGGRQISRSLPRPSNYGLQTLECEPDTMLRHLLFYGQVVFFALHSSLRTQNKASRSCS